MADIHLNSNHVFSLVRNGHESHNNYYHNETKPHKHTGALDFPFLCKAECLSRLTYVIENKMKDKYCLHSLAIMQPTPSFL